MYPVKRCNSAIFHIPPIKNVDILGKEGLFQPRYDLISMWKYSFYIWVRERKH